MTVFWTPESLADRHVIYDYIEAGNPNAAISLDERFSVAASRVSSHPYLGRLGHISGTRELVVHQNYILVYDAAGAGIRVLRGLHVARQWPAAGHKTWNPPVASAADPHAHAKQCAEQLFACAAIGLSQRFYLYTFAYFFRSLKRRQHPIQQ